MSDTNLPGNPVVRNDNGRIFADSRDVAAYFEKKHFHVLEAIRNLNCSPEFSQSNFRAFKIKDLTGESTSHVEMTRDGFMFLVMGFTGEKAAKWKEDYIAAFNAMEAELQRLAVPRLPTHLETARALVASLEREEAQKQQIQHMQPYYDGAKRLQVAEGSIGLREAADRLKIKLAKLSALLCEWQLCYRDQGGRLRHHAKFGMPRDEASSKYHGYFATEGNTQIWENGRVVDRSYIVITPKGLEAIARKLGLQKDGQQILPL